MQQIFIFPTAVPTRITQGHHEVQHCRICTLPDVVQVCMPSQSPYTLRSIHQAVCQYGVQALHKRQTMTAGHAICYEILYTQRDDTFRLGSQPTWLPFRGRQGPGHGASSGRGVDHSCAYVPNKLSRGTRCSGRTSASSVHVTRSATASAQRSGDLGALHSIEGHGIKYGSSSASAAQLNASDQRRHVPGKMQP